MFDIVLEQACLNSKASFTVVEVVEVVVVVVVEVVVVVVVVVVVEVEVVDVYIHPYKVRIIQVPTMNKLKRRPLRRAPPKKTKKIIQQTRKIFM